MDNKKPSLKVNFVYSSIYQLLILIMPLITAPYVSRVLGSNGVGIYSYSQAIANYFYLFAMLGVNNYGNRRIAQVRDNQSKLNRTFWEIYFFQLILSIVFTLLYIGFCFLGVSENRDIYLIQAFYVISAGFDVNWACFGLERFKLTTIRSTIIRIAMAVATFTLVKSQSDLWIYTFILSFGNLLAVVVIWPFVLKLIQYERPTFQGIIQHLKPNLVLFWPVLAVSLYNIMDKIMLGFFSTNDEVAFYTYAERITQLPNTLILSINNVMMPRMSNLHGNKGGDLALKLLNNVMLFAMCLSSAMAFGLAAIAPVFAPWFYGDAFTRCGLFIALLCPIIIFKGWAGVLRTQYIIPTGKDKVYVISLTLGAVSNLLLNFILIPLFNGVGAIISTIVAEFLVAFTQYWMVHKEINLKTNIQEGFCFVLLGCVMYIAIKPISHFITTPILLMVAQICAGVVIYAALSYLYIRYFCPNKFLLDILKINKNKEC